MTIKAFVVYPSEIIEPENEIKIMYGKDEDDIRQQYAEILAKDKDFREYIGDSAAFTDQFWCDHKGYMYSVYLTDDGEFQFRDDIRERFFDDEIRIKQYAADQFLCNIGEYFDGHEDLHEAFMDSLASPGKEMPDEVYLYIAKKDEEYIHLNIREVVMPDAV
jgi:hypothetical protein